jgi:hypothetical protein
MIRLGGVLDLILFGRCCVLSWKEDKKQEHQQSAVYMILSTTYDYVLV